jgi:uncharacterized membrane protein YdcZ (DUF606 family)
MKFLVPTLIIMPLFLYLAAQRPDFQAEYPLSKEAAGRGGLTFAFYEAVISSTISAGNSSSVVITGLLIMSLTSILVLNPISDIA